MKLRSKKNTLQCLRNRKWENLCSFPDEIERFLLIESGDIIVQLIFLENGRNIYLLSQNGAIKWQIQEQPHKIDLPSPYGCFEYKGGKLTATTQDSYEYEIDMSTGKILRTIAFWK
ncbi:MAG: hypothetical protein HY537_17965 [Deltaproteobacteria bacterium]|nr:hypothetical protein [Deltaproteobacteria bacterium]